VSNSAYADEVLDRYESSIFTSGKFVFGQAVYDSVLSDLPTPKTFKQYIYMSNDEQSLIDNIVKERTVARLIIKNSLNNRARNELSETYSVTNDKCYLNSISEALSLLATFKSAPNTNPNSNGAGNPVPGDDAVVSYHETNKHDVDDTATKDEANHNDDANNDAAALPRVSFEATVMAAIVAEATAEENSDLFFGASFAQLQDVADAYEDNEPDIVVSAPVVDNNDAADPEHVPDFVNEANNNAL
jgi:hypothetical protein